jgi:polysaccharide biosynthesis protein PslH
MRILFLSRWFPYPPNNGSKLRIYNLLRGLSQHHEIFFVSFSNNPEVSAPVVELQTICKGIRVVPWNPYSPKSLRARLGFFHPWPRSFLDTFSPQMAGAIKGALSSIDIDLVIASQIGTAAYSRYFMPKPALFEEIELGVLYDNVKYAKTLGNRLRNWLTWEKHRRFLSNLLPAFRACTVVSEQERNLLHNNIIDHGKTKIKVIPNCINLSDYDDVSEERKSEMLIFTGSFTYSANYEAMLWFVEKVFPIVRAQVPSVQLIISGDNGGRRLPSLENVKLAGFVSDIRPLISSAAISLAPIWTGGGTRLKILEAMALRTPVVATSKGAEGLDVQHGVHLLIADTPESYADAILQLLKNPGLCRKIGDNAYNLVKGKYDWAIVMPQFLDLVESPVFS